MNTTIEKTYEQKKTALEQKLELATELNARGQIALIKQEIFEINFQQKVTFPIVTLEQAQEEMCEKKITEHRFGWCRHIISFQFRAQTRCGKWSKHTHVEFLQKIKRDDVGLGQKMNSMFGEYFVEEQTPMPMAALIRLKEAKDRGFNAFEIWRPETADEKKMRELDPWLVGIGPNGKFFKLCDWR